MLSGKWLFQLVFIHTFALKTTLHDKILHLSKVKAFADDIINMNKNIKIYFVKDRKHWGKGRKCGIPAFSPFPTEFSSSIPFSRFMDVFLESSYCVQLFYYGMNKM